MATEEDEIKLYDMLGREFKPGQLVAKSGVWNYVSTIQLKVVDEVRHGRLYLVAKRSLKSTRYVTHPERLIIVANSIKPPEETNDDE